jgi:hypothetical protein
MEATVIKLFSFDFAFLSPLPFVERFMRFIDYLGSTKSLEPSIMLADVNMSDSSSTKPSIALYPMAIDILKHVYSMTELLQSGRIPSLIAASVIVLSNKLLTGQPVK